MELALATHCMVRILGMRAAASPTTHAQAIDRTHRIGQTKSVRVMYLDAFGTLDKWIASLMEQREKTARMLLKDGTPIGTKDHGLRQALKKLSEQLGDVHGQHKAAAGGVRGRPKRLPAAPQPVAAAELPAASVKKETTPKVEVDAEAKVKAEDAETEPDTDDEETTGGEQTGGAMVGQPGWEDAETDEEAVEADPPETALPDGGTEAAGATEVMVAAQAQAATVKRKASSLPHVALPEVAVAVPAASSSSSHADRGRIEIDLMSDSNEADDEAYTLSDSDEEEPELAVKVQKCDA